MCPDKTFKRLAVSVLIMTSLLASGTLTVSAQAKRKRPFYTVPVDTSIRVQLNEKLSSKDARVGDPFTSTVVIPVYVRGVEVIPAGSIITGSVTRVVRAGRKSSAGSLSVTFSSLRLPNSARHSINGSLASAEGADNYSTVKGKSSKKRNASFIGRGVVVGGLMNGAAGVVTGGVIGATRGLIKKGEEVEVSPGTAYNVVLNHSVAMHAFR